MNKGQKIHCTVTSCKYNDKGDQGCQLENIIVIPKQSCDAKNSEESMCSSYEHQK